LRSASGRTGRWWLVAAIAIGAGTGIAAALLRPAPANAHNLREQPVLLAKRADPSGPATKPQASSALVAEAAKPVKLAAKLPAEGMSLDERAEDTEDISLAPPATPLKIKSEIKPGEALGLALSRHGVSGLEVNKLVAALKGTVDPRAIRAGDAYTLVENDVLNGRDRVQRVDRFEFRPKADKLTTIVAKRTDDGFVVDTQRPEIQTKVVALQGEVSSSLYNGMIDKGEGVTLVNRFVDVFAWDVDFYRETRKGDHYKVIVEKKYAEGEFVGYGRVLAAEYKNGKELMRGFNFKSADGKFVGTFDERGAARMKTFLKNPLEIARITSSYGQRFHPVLRRHKAHNGVDYGASRGTPYWAVADGTVVEARYSRTAGNMIVLRHRNGYETQYFHSSKFAPGIKVGAKVKQRQVIGYVGNTGRSTGPHLHFGMKKKGRYVDPARQKFPTAKPVDKKYADEFREWVAPLMAEMKALEIS
jgi:murein DD-endopeptidase MepM/ murein hydrolase activator NlpD